MMNYQNTEDCILTYWLNVTEREQRSKELGSQLQYISEHALEMYEEACQSNHTKPFDDVTLTQTEQKSRMHGLIVTFHKNASDVEYMRKCEERVKQRATVQTNTLRSYLRHVNTLPVENFNTNPNPNPLTTFQSLVSVGARSEEYRGFAEKHTPEWFAFYIVCYMPMVMPYFLPTVKTFYKEKKDSSSKNILYTCAALAYSIFANMCSEKALLYAQSQTSKLQDRISILHGEQKSLSNLQWLFDEGLGQVGSMTSARETLIEMSAKFSTQTGLNLYDAIDTSGEIVENFIDRFPKYETTLKIFRFARSSADLPSLQIPMIEGMKRASNKYEEGMTAGGYQARFYMMASTMMLATLLSINLVAYVRNSRMKKSNAIDTMESENIVEVESKMSKTTLGHRVKSFGVNSASKIIQSLIMTYLLTQVVEAAPTVYTHMARSENMINSVRWSSEMQIDELKKIKNEPKDW
jgi:hypothetical protein